jgi:FAD/FMN-containing dehydrogenase/Fe-S oxidoreductase
MGTSTEGSADGPASDERAHYDYESGDVERPGFVRDLRERIDGEVRFDDLTRELYATDASAYEVTPVGAVFPRSTADVSAVISYCADRETPVLPRGGGTSLAGQAVNEAVILDFSRYMDSVLSVDPDGRTARAEAGVVLAELNDRLAEHDLKFAPDPAWGDKSVLGGAIGNNSTGSHSLKYGKTDAYVEECEVVLADGTVTTFGEVSLDELRERAADVPEESEDLVARIYAAVARIVDEEAEAVDAAFPDLKRNVSGYNLDRLVDEAESGSVNLARLLAGSEGTLAVVTEAVVSLESVPETKALALLAYEDLLDAMRDVTPILEHDPAAVEVLDDTLLDLASATEEFGALVNDIVPEQAGALLLVEFYAENDVKGKQFVADLLADRVPDATTVGVARERAEEITDDPLYAFAGREAHSDEERSRFWKLRKSGLPILLGRTSDEKHISFIEDTAVPPENLPEYVADFQDVLEANGTFASFYAHAGPGCLHIRPLIDTKSLDGVEQMAAIADAATDLVIEYGGSVSGEHGDGRARTKWNRKLYGDAVWELFGDLKTAFDPDWLLNPGQVCGDVDMTENLRYDPDYEFDAGFDPELRWDNDNGFQGMVELCHGCGGCRGHQDTTGGVMCPTYRASEEESTATRGRANALRQAMSGDFPEDPTSEAFMTEIMDLCIGCKGCARDCPSEVDMAKLKAELQHANHQRNGASLRDRLFADAERLARLGSALAPVSNWLSALPGSDALAETFAGIASERDLPTFHRESFVDWYADRGPAVAPEAATRRAVLVADTYNNYSDPAVLKAAVHVLEAAGVHVRVPETIRASGRAAHSQGFLEKARERARHHTEKLAPLVSEGWDVVAVEPSDAVMFQSDYLDLLATAAAESVAANAYGLCEYLSWFGLDEDVEWDPPATSLTYHGHCHQKALKKDHYAVGVLRRAGYEVDALDSGCCGMAGSFGYEAEHYSMSQAIGRILFEQVAESNGDRVVAPGASCRTQLGDRPGHDAPPHPVEQLAAAIPGR